MNEYRGILQYSKTGIVVMTKSFKLYEDALDELESLRGNYKQNTFKVCAVVPSDKNHKDFNFHKKLAAKAIEFEKYIENEFYDLFVGCVKKFNFEYAKDSFLSSASDEFYCGPDLICDDLSDYSELLDRTIMRFLAKNKK